MAKLLYQGEFNINGEDAEEFAFAHSEDHAKIEMARRIAARKGVLPVVILGYLRNHPHSYEIKLASHSPNGSGIIQPASSSALHC